MCGIFGLINTDSQVKIGDVRKSIELLAHRGPDGHGVWSDDKVALAHHRLAIFDRTDSASQPMIRNEAVLVFNGAIYNYRELREKLIGRGFSFESDSDTEVVLCAYIDEGIDCVKSFNGQWSMAIWDSKESCLYLSRDRFGIKPLYLWKNDTSIFFSSEIKAFTTMPAWQPKLNRTMAYDWLVRGQIHHRDSTLFENVTRVPAGHNLVVEVGGSMVLSQSRYYQLSNSLEGMRVLDWKNQFATTLDEAIGLRLQGDRNLGLALSGGIDSSAIAAEVTNSFGKLPAFSVVYEQDEISESKYLKAVMERLGLSSSIVSPSFEDFMQDVSSMLWHQEAPVGGFGVYAQYCLHRKASQESIQVVLGGQGADEILAGYPRFYLPVLKTVLRQNPLRAWSYFWELRDRFNHLRPVNWGSVLKFISSKPIKPRWLLLDNSCTDQPALSRMNSLRDISIGLIEGSGLQTLLHYEDRNSMAHGIESRMPFLDHRLVELCLMLPDELKIRNLWSKWILRKTMEKRLPDKIVWRRSKLGFATPQEEWLVHHRKDLVKQIEAQLGPLDKIIESAEVSSLKGDELFRVFTFTLWSKLFGIAD